MDTTHEEIVAYDIASNALCRDHSCLSHGTHESILLVQLYSNEPHQVEMLNVTQEEYQTDESADREVQSLDPLDKTRGINQQCHA